MLLLGGLFLPAAVPAARAATCGPTNLALNQPATASSAENASFPASAAVDGNTGTRWSSAFSDPQWLEVELLTWETAYATAFQIQVSPDGTTWHPHRQGHRDIGLGATAVTTFVWTISPPSS